MFHETSERPFSRGDLNTSLWRLMTSSILFMVRAKKVLASNRLNCMFSYSCSYIFDVSCLFPLLSLGWFLRKKDVLVRSSAISKLFLNRRFTFLKYILQNYYSNFKAVIFFLPHINTQIPLSAHRYLFFPCFRPFSGFFSQPKPHSHKISFWF